ncbi:hypothetical protein [Anatilimnocola floriformis]|uniref:hypothetical protein n=1 Tax=Anatilimnocola floriformis TaxID=2948575 RepID=UPI0020C2CFCB|nr:hypothetical protein [Anatilimnocola floriformis]
MAKKKSATKPKSKAKPKAKSAAKKSKHTIYAVEAALIHLAAFLELADDETVDPDSALSRLEDMTYELRGATKEEKSRLKSTLQGLIAEEEAEDEPREEMLEFYGEFLRDFS